ncbi:MAG: 1-acyl-sn-glycerol-3-phosphate acyltransferase [Clostridia bacterium]|nr:1-acyl-sn-glycerol-3-phosphate acyltransferase [Clostridia bacterium]
MKIKIKDLTYKEVMSLPTPPHHPPKKIGPFFRTLIKCISASNLKKYNVTYRESGMDRLGKKEPAIMLMNHSGFIDMQIAANYLYPRPFSTVTTTDAYVGLAWLLRRIGCIPTQKFVADLTLLKDISYALKELKTTVLMYPEAVYSFDGTASTLPDSLGAFVKRQKVPVITMIANGAFLREPLYNMLRHRKVDLTVDVTYLLSPEDLETLSADEINARLRAVFSFDAFRWQRENKIAITEDFRADGLERVLYKCPHCMAEGKTEGKGTTLTCHACGKVYELTEYGELRATDGDGIFDHIPDWFRWEREQVREELLRGEYRFEADTDVYMMVDYKAMYRVEDGHLIHNEDGFRLLGKDGAYEYMHSPLASYTVNSDYYFYEISDVISLGNKKHLFYCFPKKNAAIVAKVKLAAEELYKIKQAEMRKGKKES